MHIRHIHTYSDILGLYAVFISGFCLRGGKNLVPNCRGATSYLTWGKLIPKGGKSVPRGGMAPPEINPDMGENLQLNHECFLIPVLCKIIKCACTRTCAPVHAEP